MWWLPVFAAGSGCRNDCGGVRSVLLFHSYSKVGVWANGFSIHTPEMKYCRIHAVAAFVHPNLAVW